MRSIFGWFIAYFCRWLPHAAPTGVFPLGDPDETSPVIVTANFSLTVRRVKRALRNQSVWLLVANSEGINVWCAATGGMLTEHRVIDAIKVSGLADRVNHRGIILPRLSAPGIDRGAIHRETGFHARFGPVYAKDLPQYLQGSQSHTDQFCRVRFDLRHRLDMLLSMNFPVYLIISVVLLIFWREYFLGFTAIFWGATALLYLFVNVIPGKTGWAQAFISATLIAAIWALVDWSTVGSPLQHWGWLIATFAIFFVVSFDLAGIASPRKSDPELMLHRLGFTSLGTLFSEKDLGEITLDRDKCKGCQTCHNICPIGVYGDLDFEGKATFLSTDACFACGACVKQCPEGALKLSP